jgi:hypothetical protein
MLDGSIILQSVYTGIDVYVYSKGTMTLLIKIPNYFVNSNSMALFTRNAFVAWTNLGDISIF